QFETLAKTDRIGNVLADSIKCLAMLSKSPISYQDLSYAIDCGNAVRSVTMKHDIASPQLHLSDAGYNTMRDCCYVAAEAIEVTARSLIANNS
ncbi:hypothetical protein PFISCL1PPCAC_7020, partial [Pristionchus fissidentatus]